VDRRGGEIGGAKFSAKPGFQAAYAEIFTPARPKTIVDHVDFTCIRRPQEIAQGERRNLRGCVTHILNSVAFVKVPSTVPSFPLPITLPKVALLMRSFRVDEGDDRRTP
jgi:hypothetical protein